ncbi:MAG: MoaD/ThiS family protein [Burkholderiales bacterium]
MAERPARVVFTGDFANRYTRGVKEFEIEAKNLRRVIRILDERYPGLGDQLETETTVAIDGEIRALDYSQPVRPGCEIFFIPRIRGG